MTQKEYPKTVVLKKSIVSAVAVAAFLIVLLILHNLFNTSHAATRSTNESSSNVQSVAGQSDTNWYQNQKIKKPVEDTQPVSHTTQVYPTAPLAPLSQNPPVTEASQQELLKAMGTPITSNQLIDERPAISTNPGTNSSAQQSGSLSSSSDQNMQGEKTAFLQSQANELNSDYLETSVKDPLSPYEIQAGTTIPGALITGLNSDLPGQITGQVRSNVYDSISGKYILIPQGSKLVGVYDSQVAYGQERVLVAWERVMFPNGQSLNLEGMSGVDMTGYAGFNDQVNNHYTKIFGSVVLMSLLGAGAQLSQPQNSSNPFQAPTVGQTVAQSLGTNLANTGTMITAKNINIQPTLEIRQGYTFNISVKKDIVFAHPYQDK